MEFCESIVPTPYDFGVGRHSDSSLMAGGPPLAGPEGFQGGLSIFHSRMNEAEVTTGYKNIISYHFLICTDMCVIALKIL